MLQERDALYEIAMAIGTSLDTGEMLDACLPGFLALQGARAAAILSGHAPAVTVLRSTPDEALFSAGLSQLGEALGQQQACCVLAGQTVHLWPLSASASLVLAHAAMSDALHAAITLLAAKLGNALQACREHEELSRARSALEHSERRLMLALDVGHGVWDWNVRSGKVFFSRNWKSILGYGDSEIGDSLDEWSSRVHPEDLPRAREDMLRHFRGEASAYRREFRLKSRDGSWRWVLDQGMVFEREADGAPARVVGTFTDITEQKQGQLALQEMRDEALHSAQVKSEFLANMSHEIRTPMNGVLGMLGLLQDSDLVGEQREWLDLAKVSAENLLTVINDILDFSRIEAGKLDIHVEPLDLRATLDEVLRLLNVSAAGKGLALSLEVAADVPPMIGTDGGRLRQVLLNLVGNAVKFTSAGKVTIQVRRGDAEHAGCLHFCISDTGIGMAPPVLEKIFEAFTQADASITRRFGGTGLGLAISSRLVRLLGGEIWAESEVGKGSRFHFTLRCLTPDAEPEKIVDAPAAVSEHGLNILLAEDNPVNQRLAAALLARQGHRVMIATTGGRAVDLWRTGQFDVILMDMLMPEMDGIQATCCIREEELGTGAHIPIIAMTANAMEGDRERCLAAGMDDYVSKPIVAAALAAALSRVPSSLSGRIEQNGMLD